MNLFRACILALMLPLSSTIAAVAAQPVPTGRPIAGQVVVERIESSVLRGTRTGVDPVRNVRVYLPPGYQDSGRPYPVVYYCHNIFQGPEQVVGDGNILRLIEHAQVAGTVGPFIFVIGDYTGPTIGSLYENTAATGRWLDHTVQELVPFIDSRYRTLARPESRAVVGEMMGGRGAFQLVMIHPGVFGAVYALNPVGTSTGLLPVQTYPNWKKILTADSPEALKHEPISQIFVAASQAFMPNPQRPPFFCDFLMELKDGEPSYHAENAVKFTHEFLIYYRSDAEWGNLRQLRGLAFDWSRYDPIQDHLVGCLSISRKLELFGVSHEAEEYRGVYWEENWKEHGRFATRVLPFLQRHLVFSAPQ